MHIGLKQLPRWTGQPALHLSLEFEVREMADNTGHGDIAVAPRAAKIEVEKVVLDIWISSNRHLRLSAASQALPNSFVTHRPHTPPGQMLGHGLCNSRLLGHTQDSGHS